MKLILPTKKYEMSYYDLVKSAKDNNEILKLGNALIRDNESFDDMIKRLKDRKVGKNLDNEDDVASTLFWMLENDEIVGIIEARHYLNNYFFENFGHINLYVKKDKRNNGYGTKAFCDVVKKYRKKFTHRLILMADEDNLSAIKVIVRGGGSLDRQRFDEKSKKTINRYNIITGTDEIVVPKTVWLTTNGSCNNNCNFCHSSNFINESMDYEKTKKYIDFLSKKGITKIILVGGEPTLHKDIIKLVKYISSKGMVVSIYTNGRRFSDKTFTKKMVDAGLKCANIMMKGYNEKDYIKNTNEDGFNEMIMGYNNLKEYGIKLSVSYIIGDKNIRYFDKFLESFEENKLNNLLIQLYKPYAKKEHPYYSVHDLAKALEKAYELIKNTNIKYKFEISIPFCTINKKVLKEMMDNDKIVNNCHITKGTGMVLDHNFDVFPCNQFIEAPLNSCKVSLDELINFWNSEACVQFRSIINTYPDLKCDKCEMWEKCGGGCLIHWLNENTKEYIRDIYKKKGK